MRELDEQCARALGWKRMHGNLTEWYGPDGTYLRQDYDFRPSEWADDAVLLENDIEARGLEDQYCIALFNMIVLHRFKDATNAWEHEPLRTWWWAIRATPEQRACAYLKARGL